MKAKSTFQIALEELITDVQTLDVSVEELRASLAPLVAKFECAMETKRTLEQQQAQLNDINSKNAGMYISTWKCQDLILLFI
jgi:hypothetical protein